MSSSSRDVTASELAVLQELWGRESATVRELSDGLYGKTGPSQVASVTKLLERLETKGHVDRDRSVTPQHFRARVDRESLLGERLRSLAEDLCEGSFAPLLTHLVSHKALSSSELDRLRAMIDDAAPPESSSSKIPTTKASPRKKSRKKRGRRS